MPPKKGRGRPRSKPKEVIDDLEPIEEPIEEATVSVDLEEEVVIPLREVVEPPEVSDVVVKADVRCQNCGLTVAEYLDLMPRIRPDIARNLKDKCPRCGEPL